MTSVHCVCYKMSDGVQNDWMSHHYPMAWLPYSAREEIAIFIDGAISPGSGFMKLAELLEYDVKTSRAFYQRSIGNPTVSNSPTHYLFNVYGEEADASIQKLQMALLRMKHVAAAVIPTYIPKIANNHPVPRQQAERTSIVDAKGSQCNCQEYVQQQKPAPGYKTVNKSVPSDQNMDQPTEMEQRPACPCNSGHQMINVQDTSVGNHTFKPMHPGFSETDNTFLMTCSNPQDDEEKGGFSSQMDSHGVPCINEIDDSTLVKSVVTSQMMDSCGENLMACSSDCHQVAQNIIKKGTASNAPKSTWSDKSFTAIRHSWHDQSDNSSMKNHLLQSSSDSLILKLCRAHASERDFEQTYNRVTSYSDGCRQNFVKHHTQSSNIQNRNSLSNLGCVDTNVHNGPQHRRNNRDIGAFVTYSYNSLVDLESIIQEVVNLCNILRQSGVRVRVDMDSDSYKRLGVNKRDWIESVFKEASFIIACVTPAYANDVQPPTSNVANASESPLNAHYIYSLIHREFFQNQCLNYRVIPVLFKHSGANITHVPPCMQFPCVYTYPDQIENIVQRLV